MIYLDVLVAIISTDNVLVTTVSLEHNMFNEHRPEGAECLGQGQLTLRLEALMTSIYAQDCQFEYMFKVNFNIMYIN